MWGEVTLGLSVGRGYFGVECGQTGYLGVEWREVTLGLSVDRMASVRPYSFHCPNCLTKSTHMGSVLVKTSRSAKSAHDTSNSTLPRDRFSRDLGPSILSSALLGCPHSSQLSVGSVVLIGCASCSFRTRAPGLC